jgi:hypothetical protein
MCVCVCVREIERRRAKLRCLLYIKSVSVLES